MNVHCLISTSPQASSTHMSNLCSFIWIISHANDSGSFIHLKWADFNVISICHSTGSEAFSAYMKSFKLSIVKYNRSEVCSAYIKWSDNVLDTFLP